jgi:peptidoglycan/LPS O-acetylase OafA/YrhL
MVVNQIVASKRIFGLDLLRTMAILMVLFGHCLLIYPPNHSLIYQIGTFFGYLGVEVFFVLSGFLLGRSLYQLYVKEDFSLRTVYTFLQKKGFRLLPSYYLVLFLNFMISFIVGYAIVDWWNYLFFLQNFNSPQLPFFPESWSLSVGVFAFLLLPLTLFFKTAIVKPRNKSTFFFMVVLGLTLFFVITKVYYAFSTQNTTLNQWNLSLKAVVVYRLDALFLGVLAAWISLRFQPFWEKMRWFFAFLGLVVFGFLFVGVGFFQLTIDKFPFFWNVFYLPITSLMCVLFLPLLTQWESTKFTLFTKPIVFISLISYSVYLLHYGVVLQLFLFYVPTDSLSMYQLHLYLFCYLVVTFLLSFLFYKFFEKPLLYLGKK